MKIQANSSGTRSIEIQESHLQTIEKITQDKIFAFFVINFPPHFF